jgi:hypothetical protein
MRLRCQSISAGVLSTCLSFVYVNVKPTAGLQSLVPRIPRRVNSGMLHQVSRTPARLDLVVELASARHDHIIELT